MCNDRIPVVVQKYFLLYRLCSCHHTKVDFVVSLKCYDKASFIVNASLENICALSKTISARENFVRFPNIVTFSVSFF